MFCWVIGRVKLGYSTCFVGLFEVLWTLIDFMLGGVLGGQFIIFGFIFNRNRIATNTFAIIKNPLD